MIKQRFSYLSLSIIFTFLAVVGSFYQPVVVAAQTDCNEEKLRALGVIVVTCDGAILQCAEGSVDSLRGRDNPEKAFNYFLDRGLTHEQSAGILGNMMQESGVNPERIQVGFGPATSKDPADAGTGGWGIIQWTPGNKIISIAEQASINLSQNPIHELKTQLDIVWWHLNEITPTGRKNVLPDFKATTTVAEATEFFEDKVEGAGIVALNKRINFANQVLKLYGDSFSTTLAGTSANCVGATQLNNGFIIYSQYDPRWKDSAYATSTIGESGCGPAALAMVVTELTNRTVTPVDTSEVAADLNQYVDGVGSKWSISPTLAEHYGLQADSIATDINEITAALRAGKMVVTAGKGALPFTEGGHFIVIRGITMNGNWLIGNSDEASTNEREWAPEELFTQMERRAGSAYAIY